MILGSSVHTAKTKHAIALNSKGGGSYPERVVVSISQL